MKVLLIDPPFGAEEVGGKQASFEGVLNIIPALGLAYLAAVAEQEGHEVQILDCARGLGWEAIRDTGRRFAPDAVGVTATTPTFANAVRTANVIREVAPKAVRVLGGPHPTAIPDHAAAAQAFDYLVLGEGERTFVDLLRHLEGKGPERADDIPGLAFLRDGNVAVTPPRALIQDLDSIPFPARHLLPPLKDYSPTPASYRKLPLAHIMTARGCPSRCRFCDRAIFGESFRARSADNVLAEVQEVVHKHGAREIRFFDDTFTLGRKRLEAICRGMKGFRPRIPWTCLTKVTSVNPEMLRIMREAGCWQVLFGLESGDDGVLASLNKKNTVEQNRNAVLWARQAGLRVRADFIVGTPQETMETLRRTVAFAKSLPLDFAHFNKFVPFPGTEFYRQLVAEGYKFDFSGSSSTLDHDALVFVPQAIPEREYREFLDKAYKEFYFRPTYLVRRLFGMRTFTEFWGHVKGFASIGSI